MTDHNHNHKFGFLIDASRCIDCRGDAFFDAPIILGGFIHNRAYAKKPDSPVINRDKRFYPCASPFISGYVFGFA